ncbi:MAG: macro domain-containing protein [Acidobacteria bacterium]|nr:macro domain-containing protein [Acidobacteriota bacterium]
MKRIDYPNGRRFEVVIYDLLDEPTDAIVNAANGGLSHGGGIAAAISDAAGPALDDEGNRIVRERGRIPVGEAVVTTAGKLRFKGVIHAVGPRLGGGNEGEKIVRALKSAFLRAHERSWSSVSFPAISSGIFSVPYEVCVRAYLGAVCEFFEEYPDSSVKWIRLVLFQGPILEVVKRELGHQGRSNS